jgi:hypothetical protein
MRVLGLGAAAPLLISLALGCDAGAPPTPAVAESAATLAPASASKPAAATDGKATPKSFGDPITKGEPTTLAEVVASPAKYANQEIRTEGVVKAVCQKAGCWMEIGDETSQAHIKMAGHRFVVPRSSSGRRAIVQGTVKDGAPANECGSKDQCGGTENGAVAKVEIVATGVEFID